MLRATGVVYGKTETQDDWEFAVDLSFVALLQRQAVSSFDRLVFV
jgi:hypothetical protein